MTPEVEEAIRNEFLCRIVADAFALLGRKADALRWLRAAVGYGFINYPNLSVHGGFLESGMGSGGCANGASNTTAAWSAPGRLRHCHIDQVGRMERLAAVKKSGCKSVGIGTKQGQVDGHRGVDDDHRASRSARTAAAADSSIATASSLEAPMDSLGNVADLDNSCHM